VGREVRGYAIQERFFAFASRPEIVSDRFPEEKMVGTLRSE
jgi:hypothetical protein